MSAASGGGGLIVLLKVRLQRPVGVRAEGHGSCRGYRRNREENTIIVAGG